MSNIDKVSSSPFLTMKNSFLNRIGNKLSDITKNFFKDIRFHSNINVIIADDDVLIRESTRRILLQSSMNLNLTINILETCDGVETLYLYYMAYINNIKIFAIFSDENMSFLNGKDSSEIIVNILKSKNIKAAPFYLLTSIIQKEQIKSSFCYEEVIAKPLNNYDATRILKKF